MANNVNIVIGPSALNAPLKGEDFISGYIHYVNQLPAGFASYGTYQEIFSVAEAESLGITNTHIGETRATASTTITGTGATGAIININVATNANIVTLGSYTVTSADTKNTIVSNLATNINATTNVHGFTTTASTATLLVSAPAGTGLGANNFLFSNTTGGTASVSYSSTTFTGGVASQIDIIHYHLQEAFRANDQLDLYVMIQSAATTFAEIVTLQNQANGKLRQVGIYNQVAFATAQVDAIQAQINTCATNFKPLEVIYQADFTAYTDITTLPDLTQLVDKNVSVTIGQDAGNLGEALYQATAKSIGSVGITLGTVSSSNVAQSIAWVGKYNVSDVELETLGFANGNFYNSLTDNLLNAIENKGYIFLKKYIGITGSYFNNPLTCISSTSDFSVINHNRTINKASRNIRTYLLPSIASPILINSDGTISPDVISFFQTQTSQALEQMVSNSELSNFAVTINPSQNVLSTNQIIINVALQPVGVANNIIVNMAFALSV